MEDVLEFIGKVLLAFGFWWLVGSLLAWDFNPGGWIVFGRVMWVLFGIMSIGAMYKDD